MITWFRRAAIEAVTALARRQHQGARTLSGAGL
jgi:hypothetical protein